MPHLQKDDKTGLATFQNRGKMMGETITPYYGKRGSTKGKQFINCTFIYPITRKVCGNPVEVGPGKTSYVCPLCGAELKMDISGEGETYA